MSYYITPEIAAGLTEFEASVFVSFQRWSVRISSFSDTAGTRLAGADRERPNILVASPPGRLRITKLPDPQNP
jgi:hypothetical protein